MVILKSKNGKRKVMNRKISKQDQSLGLKEVPFGSDTLIDPISCDPLILGCMHGR
ncbi:MAG: hypothetical protein ACJA04_000502 [Cellvibrionaceae bacterium]|jgi:hypothetical protein